MIIYHGSKDIIEKPEFGKGNKKNDYGLGFYCTENVELAKEAERNVHKLGFIVSMDDFGTGYSSFSMLKNINIDVLKMDKSFFDDVLESRRGKIIIEAVIEMAHKLGIKVVAEGIERKGCQAPALHL